MKDIVVEVQMSEHEKGHVDCPFSGHDIETVNVKFFRGRRDDVITAEEIREQARSAFMQCRMKAATISTVAPISSHPPVDVEEFVKSL
jgi:hypothetical protein